MNIEDLKLFWLIRNDQYYPDFGLSDVKGTFHTYIEASEAEKADRASCGDREDDYSWRIIDITDKVVPREINPEYNWRES